MRIVSKPLVIASAAALLTGCQVTFGVPSASSPGVTGPMVPKRDIEQIVAQDVREQVGGGPIVVTCPRDLPVEVGASQECVLTQGGRQYEITVAITKTTSPKNAIFEWEVGPEITDI